MARTPLRTPETQRLASQARDSRLLLDFLAFLRCQGYSLSEVESEDMALICRYLGVDYEAQKQEEVAVVAFLRDQQKHNST